MGVLGLRQINTSRKVPFQGNFFSWQHFALLTISLIFLRIQWSPVNGTIIQTQIYRTGIVMYKPFKVKCSACLCSLWFVNTACLSCNDLLSACLSTFRLSAILSPCHTASLSKVLPVWSRDIQPVCLSICLSFFMFVLSSRPHVYD